MTSALESHCHYTEMRCGPAPVQLNGKIKMVDMPLTAGSYLMTVTGTGGTVSEAQEAAYKRIWKLKPPTNRMFRTDIGDRLKAQLPELQSHDYATKMRY
jgi:phosphoribosylamine-glycine ligase